MSIPINGRIAIIDDKINQAQPLINILSKNQKPHTYFSGDPKYLPVDGENYNDIRVLFLDINLIDDATHQDKVLKAKLVPVLKRVISSKNFPYVIVYWSRNDNEYDSLIKDIFDNDLDDRKPIGFTSANKSDFFNYDGTETEDSEENLESLFGKVTNLINDDPVHSYLLQWENQIHQSTDLTLQEVFSSYHEFKDWTDNANFIMNKLGSSYSGKTYKSQIAENKLKSSFNALNIVLNDTIEHTINTTAIEKPQELQISGNILSDNIYSINSKLLLNGATDPIEYSGAIIEDINLKTEAIFKDLLNNSIDRNHIQNIIPDIDKVDKTEREISKLVDKNAKAIRGNIRKEWKKIYCTVTPLCDYVQGKNEYNRCVKGMLIKSDYLDYIDDKSEAIFISPIFDLKGEKYILILNFRYFFTSTNTHNIKHIKPLFRARQQLLSEIQSKLARHINRQGILFLS
ncbi:hypothetical protein MBM09_09785 [Flaviramulus sp. BrNp1-15]|uniref:hypothetical protein n=1 Tax=Flaviramulus sp. BrNp1-15 TaxID=2916754 RepID=UPI001EE84E19|nr:hypothetical protein [Flaviramulus sp. BrNp1-15]ULC58208.1 hypothetical protein MBM09_09785 [Flaviramulus sp. BrNp1-15]